MMKSILAALAFDSQVWSLEMPIPTDPAWNELGVFGWSAMPTPNPEFVKRQGGSYATICGYLSGDISRYTNCAK
jgi:hypothetical protein